MVFNFMDGYKRVVKLGAKLNNVTGSSSDQSRPVSVTLSRSELAELNKDPGQLHNVRAVLDVRY